MLCLRGLCTRWKSLGFEDGDAIKTELYLIVYCNAC